jgi:predicted MFS family arabinose efflux permease
MTLQGGALLVIGYNPVLILPYILLGAGTAMVYPTFLVGISNNSHPSWRPKAMSAYRFWRDMGYVAGALLGFIALQFGQAHTAFYGIALLTLLTAGIFWKGYR